MAVRQVVVSDLSGIELGDDDHARVVVEHPDYATPLELDISVDEALRLQDSTLRLVNFTILAPNRPPRRASIESKTLDKLFDGVDIGRVLDSARPARSARAAAPSRSNGAAPAERRRPPVRAGDRIDYSTPEHAGIIHRGRVTEQEAALVRADVARANANRARVGQPAIDAGDARERQRYGL